MFPTLVIFTTRAAIFASSFETAPLGLTIVWDDVQAAASDFATIPVVAAVITAVVGISLVVYVIGKLYDLVGSGQ